MNDIWQQNYNKLLKYQESYGDTNVPKNYVDQKLARLVITLRQQKRLGILPAERELALHQIGFEFEPQDTHWTKVYNSVVDFYKLNGHASPKRRSENEHERALGNWVHRMHKLIRNGQLSDDKIFQLSLINIDGDPAKYKITNKGLPEIFNTMLNRLKSHIDVYGPVIHSEMIEPDLNSWLVLQVNRIKNSLISSKEYVALVKTGFSADENIDLKLIKTSNQK